MFDLLTRPSIIRFRLSSRVVAHLLGLVLLSSSANAQQNARSKQFNNPGPTQIAAALDRLSGQSRVTIGRLSKLGELSVQGWRYHNGDVPHGESETMDDSSWPVIQIPFHAQTKDVVWLRNRIVVPKAIDGYDLTGARLWIHGDLHDTLAIFLNGEPVGKGEPFEPVVLFSSPKPGDSLQIAIRYSSTARPKDIPYIEVHVDFANNRPNPQDIYDEFITAALLIPDLSQKLAADTATLDKAIQDIDLNALNAQDQKRFDDSLRKAQQALEVLRPVLQRANFHLSGNSHIDAAWLWPVTETVDIVRRTFGTALRLMDEYPSYTYSQSSIVYNEWMAEKYPEMNAEIKKRVQEGRWEIVGGMWVEPDLNLPDGESQVRQLLVGQRETQRLYGVTAHVGWNPDSFGYDWQLPQIYKKSGIDYFITQKLSFNETNPFPFKLFWWESPDGSKVLTYLPHNYNNNDLSPVRLSNDLIHARTLNPGLTDLMDLYGIGDHGGGPTRAVLNQGLHWMQSNKIVPRMEYGTAQSYLSKIETNLSAESPTLNYQAMANGEGKLPNSALGEVTVPTWKDEMYFEHHRGVYTTQAGMKRNLRESEEWMLDAEKYSSLAWLDGKAYPNTELTEAWKKVLFNQFHDLAAGSGVGVIYRDAQRDYDQARWATAETSKAALNAIQARIDTHSAGVVPILIFNPLGWDRSGVADVDIEMPVESEGITILDKDDHVVPSETIATDSATNISRVLINLKNVPSLGYDILHAVPGKRRFDTDLKVNGLTLENSFLKVKVDSSNGCITSLYDKKSNFESLAAGACGNELQAFNDHSTVETAWNIDPGTFDHFTPIAQVDSVKLVENTPFRAVIRISRTWQSSKFVQNIILYAQSDQVEVVNDIDWHETFVLIKAAFPLAVASKMATYEIPYGTIERPTTRANSWDAAKFEVPALRWADLGDGRHGFSLINEAKYGYDCKDNVLRLTLLRSPVDPDPVADRGHQHFSYALYPHGGDWRSAMTIRHGFDYNYKLLAMQVGSHVGSMPLEHSFVSVKGDNVILTAVKKAEDTDALVLRFYEWAGKSGDIQLTVPKGATAATFTNLMENPEGPPLSVVDSEQVTVPVTPYAIETVELAYAHNAKQQN